jgi:hypothetical protein
MEMSRFQIEEIIGQDMHGVVYRASDSESGRTVALRRFLPFGQDGGGLEKEEAIAFEIATKRLADVSHVALRSVLYGSTDPIDGIPYLVTEWVDGMSLSDILAGETLDPALIIDVLRIALEVSIVLSHILGEEAVWVETDVHSIIIGTRDSGRGFTFWISPFKWLGGEFQSRKLSSIVDLGEELAGWQRKVVSDQAGYGLGGWMKWLKKNPDVRLTEALETLAASTGNEPPPAEADLVERATNPKNSIPKQASTSKALVFTAVIALLVISSALFCLHKTAKPPVIAGKYSEQEISPVIHEPGSASGSSASPAAKVQTPAERASARAEELKIELARATVKTSPPQTHASDKIHTSEDKKLFANIKSGTPMKLGGVLRRVKLSSTGKSIYLFLEDSTDPEKLAGVVHKSNFKGDFRNEAFTPMIGKKLVLTGTCFKEPGGRILAKIVDVKQIQVIPE